MVGYAASQTNGVLFQGESSVADCNKMQPVGLNVSWYSLVICQLCCDFGLWICLRWVDKLVNLSGTQTLGSTLCHRWHTLACHLWPCIDSVYQTPLRNMIVYHCQALPLQRGSISIVRLTRFHGYVVINSFQIICINDKLEIPSTVQVMALLCLCILHLTLTLTFNFAEISSTECILMSSQHTPTQC